MHWVNQERDTVVSTSSRDHAAAKASGPPLQVRYFSTSHAASPAGESTRAAASVSTMSDRHRSASSVSATWVAKGTGADEATAMVRHHGRHDHRGVGTG